MTITLKNSVVKEAINIKPTSMEELASRKLEVQNILRDALNDTDELMKYFEKLIEKE